ncbi:hypothetical protein BWP06_12515 [Enterobacter cloacae]|nr:hypothetical protein BWP06_12515 [Enterobacter cloacae]
MIGHYRCRHFVANSITVLLQAFEFNAFYFQATKNPSTLNQNGGVDGLHKLGTSKKSSGTSYDCPLIKKFCA